jgi:hypothetical protein
MLNRLAVLAAAGAAALFAAQTRQADIVIYGATSAGVVAAVQAARMGKSVLLVEPGAHIGGLTTGGLSWTDIGNKQVIGGLAREFYRRIKAKYDAPQAWVWETREQYFKSRRTANVAGEDAMWTFEPKVASQVYREMLAEHGLTVITRARLDLRPGRGVILRSGRIEAIVMENGDRYAGQMFIDATYEGDLMAKAGVSYTFGRESNSVYGENYNGVQAEHRHLHQFPDGVRISPYVIPGNPASGLLPWIDPAGPGRRGEGDKRIQAYCFRMCMTNASGNRIPVAKPEGYDERDHELLLRYAESGRYHNPSNKWDPIPNMKTDTNNHGAVSTDFIGANYDYPDGGYDVREKIVLRHRIYTQGYLWTLQNHPRVPEKLREWYRQWGLPKDEFTDNGNWPAQLYIREARRMVSDVVMNENHVVGRILAQDSVGMGAYGMDSHNVQRYVTPEGFVRNEGNVQVGGFAPYPISYRSIVPRRGQVSNLFVPVCLSASHIAYGSIRMEPVFMILGQSAATAAALAIDARLAAQDLDYAKLRERLLKDRQILEAPPEVRRGGGMDPAKLEGIVLDDSQAERSEGWTFSRAAPSYLGQNYLHDGNTRDGKASVVFRVTMPQGGRYRIRLLYPVNQNRATNTPVTISFPGGKRQAVINQRRESPWLGPYDLPASFTVTVTNAGTDGYVVVDGLQVVPASP